MKRLTLALSAVTILVLASVPNIAWSYDSGMANSYAELFAPATGAAVGKKLHLVKVDKFVDKVKANEALTVIDVRTPAEMSVISATLPGTLRIPINELFTEENLARIPTDRNVYILCQSGTRATAAGTALRHIGFKNVYILKGGLKALIGYMGPKEANTPLQKTADK